MQKTEGEKAETNEEEKKQTPIEEPATPKVVTEVKPIEEEPKEANSPSVSSPPQIEVDKQEITEEKTNEPVRPIEPVIKVDEVVKIDLKPNQGQLNVQEKTVEVDEKKVDETATIEEKKIEEKLTNDGEDKPTVEATKVEEKTKVEENKLEETPIKVEEKSNVEELKVEEEKAKVEEKKVDETANNSNPESSPKVSAEGEVKPETETDDSYTGIRLIHHIFIYHTTFKIKLLTLIVIF